MPKPASEDMAGINMEAMMQELLSQRRELTALQSIVTAKDQEIRRLQAQVVGQEDWRQEVMAACEMPAKIYVSLLKSALPAMPKSPQPTPQQSGVSSSSEARANTRDSDL